MEANDEIREFKHKNNDSNVIVEYNNTRGCNKQHLYMVVIGHVDAGKSTLMGHLLCDLGQVCVDIKFLCFIIYLIYILK